MASPAGTPTRPKSQRQVSRVPGGFEDTDDDLSPIEEGSSEQEPQPALPQHSTKTTDHARSADNSMFTASSETGGIALPEDASTIEEREIRRKLMDEDSTFLPPLSPFAGSGRYDTLTSGSVQSSPDTVKEATSGTARAPNDSRAASTLKQSIEYDETPESAETPSGMYKTPALGREKSSPESMSSSPTAQAAARRPSRSTSMASKDGQKPADGEGETYSTDSIADEEGGDTPRKRQSRQPTILRDTETPTPTQPIFPIDVDEGTNGDTESTDLHSPRSRKRPKFYSSRVATQSSSYSTYTITSTQGDNDLTVGADYALQTGGAAPFSESISSRPRMDYSRSTSLGSILSGISGLSEEDKAGNERQATDHEGTSTAHDGDPSVPMTPRVVSNSTEIPTDTALAQRVKDIEVPVTAAREYRDRHRPPSPDKRAGASAPSLHKNGRVLTLKEQSGTIDRLTKENFDLKMKITFLNDSLNKRSPEGVAGLVDENADLKAAKVASAKEIRDLKRNIRDLERTLRGKEGEIAEFLRNTRKGAEQAPFSNEDTNAIEEELIYLRDRVVSYDVEIERVRHERFEQKRETDKLAKLLNYHRSHGSDAGAREEIVRKLNDLSSIYAY